MKFNESGNGLSRNEKHPVIAPNFNFPIRRQSAYAKLLAINRFKK